MLLYAVGSILFAFSLMAAFAVIASSFRLYGPQMRAALGNLSLDSAYATAAPTIIHPADVAPARITPDRSRVAAA
jgi:hypothetical protein